MHVYYNKPDDQTLFVKLVREGATESQAINQLQLMGIEPSLIGRYDDVVIYFNTDSIFFNKNKKKNNLPYYHGKRRY